MKGVKGSGPGAREGERKISLEEYMDFCDSPHRPDFVIQQLNHIIFMHGFIRLHRRAKAEIMSILDAMELMHAARSTVEEGSAARGGGTAPLAAEEVSRDLEAIGWRECPIGSVQSVGLPAAEDAVPITSSVSAIAGGGPAAGEKAAKEGRKRKRKRKLAAPRQLPLELEPAPPNC